MQKNCAANLGFFPKNLIMIVYMIVLSLQNSNVTGVMSYFANMLGFIVEQNKRPRHREFTPVICVYAFCVF